MIHPVIDQTGIIHIFKGKQAEPIKLVIGEILTAEIMDIFPTGTIQIKINNRVINAQPHRELPLNKGDTVTVKVEKPLEDGTIPLRLLSTTETEQLHRTITQTEQELSDKIFKLIANLFSENTPQKFVFNETKQSPTDLIKAILSLPTEKLSDPQKTALMEKIIEIFISQRTTAENLQQLIKLLEGSSISREQLIQLKNLIITLQKDLTADKLKEVLLNSGACFEAKIKQSLTDYLKIEQINQDLKPILNDIIKEAKSLGFEEITVKAEQILKQIEGYQIISKTYQSFFTFLPILWNNIEGGSFAYKSLKRQGKDYHTVFVNINFKEENFLSFIVTMIKKNFYISFSGNKDVLDLIKAYENELKEQFVKHGMILGGIKYVNKLQELIKQWDIKEGQVNITV